MFYNWSQEDFMAMWNGLEYKVASGGTVTEIAHDIHGNPLILTQSIVETWARQLGDREANKLGIDAQRVDKWEEIRNRALKAPAVYEDEVESVVPEPPPVADPKIAKKKPGRPKKVAVAEPAPEPAVADDTEGFEV